MWQKQARQISLLSKSETAPLKTKGQRRVEEAEKRQEQLLQILRKELEHNERMVSKPRCPYAGVAHPLMRHCILQ